MDGKLLILCDEDPRDEERLTIRDKYFLVSEMWDPEDNTDMLFVSFDALIPEDRTFIKQCRYYASFRGQPAADFPLTQRGKTNPKYGTIRGSIQEQSYLNTYLRYVTHIKDIQQIGEDAQAEMLDLACQYPFLANANFFFDFSDILSKHGIVRILPAFKKGRNQDFVKYRQLLLKAWSEQNKFSGAHKAYASLLEPFCYDEFGELYSKASEELMNIMSLPVFGESKKPPRL